MGYDAVVENLMLLGFVRSNIADFLSKFGKNSEERRKIKDYVLDEMTDYQLLNLIVDGKFTNVKSNIIHEYYLFDKFSKKACNILSKVLHKFPDKDIILESIGNMVPFRLIGNFDSRLSKLYYFKNNIDKFRMTPAQLMEFKQYVRNKMISVLLNEAEASFDPVLVKEYIGMVRFLEQKGQPSGIEAYYPVSNPKHSMYDIGGPAGPRIGSPRDIGGPSGADAYTAHAPARVGSPHDIGGPAGPPIGSPHDIGGPSGADAYTAHAPAAAPAAATGAGGISGFLKGLVDKAQGALSSVQSYISANPAVAAGIGGGILAGILAYAGKKIYDKYFSQAARTCASLTGEARSRCIQNAKNRALAAEVSQLRSSMSLCNRTKDPEGCRRKIAEKISNLTSR